MGSPIELNDTLKLPRGRGFPENVEVGGVYDFTIGGRRIYNLSPSRVFLVEEVDGKWNYIGHALVLHQRIDAASETTAGRFEVTRIYPRDYAKLVNGFEAPPGRGYVEPVRSSGIVPDAA